MTPLRQAMLDQCRLRGLSPRTQDTYLYAVEQLSRYYRQRPDTLTESQLDGYFQYLALEKGVSRSTVYVQLNGIHFFFEHVLKRQFSITKPLVRKPHKLPVLLNQAAVLRIISHCVNAKYRTMLLVYYGTGLRLMELIHARVQDIDGQRGTLKVVCGKGNKDRYVVLTPTVLDILRAYWREYHPVEWLFYSCANRQQPVSGSSVSKALRAAVRAADIRQDFSIHSLRHAYATHQLAAGMPINELQNQLGHAQLSTTQRYLHWLPEMGSGAKDLLATWQAS